MFYNRYARFATEAEAEAFSQGVSLVNDPSLVVTEVLIDPDDPPLPWLVHIQDADHQSDQPEEINLQDY